MCTMHGHIKRVAGALSLAVLVGLVVAAIGHRSRPAQSGGGAHAHLIPVGRERRYAVVSGNNHGRSRSAIARVCRGRCRQDGFGSSELGGVAAGDLLVRVGKGATETLEALAETRRRIELDQKHSPESLAILFFFFSGHSDGVSLEFGDDPLSFADLHRALVDTGASARIAIIDSCKSGSVLGIKGGRLGTGFDTHLLDEIAVTGEAFLSSSTSNELALESRELGGSFFTHYLLSGLRGAADGDGNARVTLGEAYRYAAFRTRAATRDTLYGAESPSFDYRLVGQGEFNVTDLRRPASSVKLVAGFDRILVRDRTRSNASLGRGRPGRRASFGVTCRRLFASCDARTPRVHVDLVAGT